MLLTISLLCAAPLPQKGPTPSDSLIDLHRGGRTWAEFFEAAKARKDMWRENFDQGQPDSVMVARLTAVGRHWRILAVAEDWCGDSANTVPYLARLAEAVPNLELRIVDSKRGRWVMERNRTADGRAATPTIVVLDDQDAEVGVFIERPAALKTWVAENKPKLSDDEFQTAKMKWYKEDLGRHTVAEVIGLIEAASNRH